MENLSHLDRSKRVLVFQEAATSIQPPFPYARGP